MTAPKLRFKSVKGAPRGEQLVFDGDSCVGVVWKWKGLWAYADGVGDAPRGTKKLRKKAAQCLAFAYAAARHREDIEALGGKGDRR